MTGGGTAVTFELAAPDGGGKQRAFEVLDKLSVIDISNNPATPRPDHPPGHHHPPGDGAGVAGRHRPGDGVVRVSVGLEGTEDLIADLDG